MSADKQRFSVSPDVSWQDGPWQRHHFPSHTIWTRARSTARGADISHQSIWRRGADTDSDNETWDTERRETAELAGSRGRGQEVAVFPTRRKQPSSCRGWSHYRWMWVTLPGFHRAFSPQAFIWSQGIWILHVIPRALEYCTVSRSLVPCTWMRIIWI